MSAGARSSSRPAAVGAAPGFTSSGNTADSVSMSVMAGVALLCYAANLSWLRPGGRRG